MFIPKYDYEYYIDKQHKNVFFFHQAHGDYKIKQLDEAFVQYALLAELGYEVAQSNAAFMLDRNEVPMLNTNEALARALLYWGRGAAQGYSAAQVCLLPFNIFPFSIIILF